MKNTINKYLIALFGVMISLIGFTACTDQDDVEIGYDAVVDITASHLFDSYSPNETGDFDMSTDGWILNIEFLVYNASGQLAYQEHFESPSLTMVFQPMVNLAPGRYRAISIASFSRKEGNSDYKYWIIDNKEDLSSLSITENTSYFPLVFETLGIDSQELIVDNNPISISVDIKPVTSLVTVFMDDRQYLHYGVDGKYSAKCRMVAQYNIRSLSSNSVVRFDNDGHFDCQTKEQSSEYNTAISRPHDKLDAKADPKSVCYRALLPENNKEFQWQIYNREDDLTDLVYILVGDYPTQGKSDTSIDIKSGNQYALMMLLDAGKLLLKETNKDAFNYDDYATSYMEDYEETLIDDMLNFGYDKMLGFSESQMNSYFRNQPYDYSATGTVAYYPHSAANHFEQFVTVRYDDANRDKANRIMLSLSVPYTTAGTVIEQPLSQNIINVLVSKLNTKYTAYSQIGDVYQWVDGASAKEADCGITLDVSKPGNENLFYDVITHSSSDDPAEMVAKIFSHEWESYLGKTSSDIISIFGSNYDFDTDTWVYSNYNEAISVLSFTAYSSETINSIMILINNPTDALNNEVTEYLKSKYVELSEGRYSDSDDYFSRTFSLSFSNGMLFYNAYL